jgi:hypothetical protein
MQKCIYIESHDETCVQLVKQKISVTDNHMHFQNKYFKATVPVISSPTGITQVTAHIIIFERGQNLVSMFGKYPETEIRVLLFKSDLVDLADEFSDVCLDVEAEVFRWEVEDDEEPGVRLRKILECHRWCEDESDDEFVSDAEAMSFEALLGEINRVKDLCASDSLSDDERRQLAATTALKFARLLGDEQFLANLVE